MFCIKGLFLPKIMPRRNATMRENVLFKLNALSSIALQIKASSSLPILDELSRYMPRALA